MSGQLTQPQPGPRANERPQKTVPDFSPVQPVRVSEKSKLSSMFLCFPAEYLWEKRYFSWSVSFLLVCFFVCRRRKLSPSQSGCENRVELKAPKTWRRAPVNAVFLSLHHPFPLQSCRAPWHSWDLKSLIATIIHWGKNIPSAKFNPPPTLCTLTAEPAGRGHSHDA